jgi:dynein heavy chain
VPYVDYGKLQEAIEHQMYLCGLQKVETFVTKIIQVHETQLVRHGVMVVGESGSGKSTNCIVLSRALSQLKAEGIVDKDGFFKQVNRCARALVARHAACDDGIVCCLLAG